MRSFLFLLVLFIQFNSVLSAQETELERPYRMGHDHGYFPYDNEACEDKKSKCASTALAAYLNEVYNAPLDIDGNQIEGKITLVFIVEKDGRLSNYRVFEDPSEGKQLTAAAIMAMEKMNESGIRWVPGEYKGQVVRSEQSLIFPVKYVPPVNAPEEKNIYKVVERMPMFPYDEANCDGYDDQSIARCAQVALLEYVYGNVRYPPLARKNKTEGMALISFVVSSTGSIYNPKLVRDPGDGTGEEALRVIEQMIEDDIIWIPGTQGGSPRDVQFNLPVKFKL